MLYATVIFIVIFTIASVFWWVQIVKTRWLLTKWIKKVPGYPIIGNIFDFGDNTDTLNDMRRLKEKYGNVFYLEFFGFPSVIIYSDLSLIECLLSSQCAVTKGRPYRLFEGWLGTGLILSKATKWRKRRRLITPAFHFSILEKYIETFERNSLIMVNQLSNEVGSGSLDVCPIVTACSLNIICETAMGVSVNAHLKEGAEYVRDVKETCRLILKRAFSLLNIFDIFYVFSKDFYTERKLVKNLHDFTNSVIIKRIEELKNKSINKDETNNGEDDVIGRRKKLAFLDLLINSTEDGKPLSLEDIREEVDTFMFAGHDTSSSATALAMYSLAENRDAQIRAFEEQKEIFTTDRDRTLTYQDLQNMKYLENVIKETLRLYPAVPMFSRELTEDLEYKGNKIPKGVTLTVLAYGMHRDPDIYDNPEIFDPSRFETTEGKKPYSYIPFSAGPRNCIGHKFAMLEMKTMLSIVLRHFDIYPPNPKHKIILANEAVLTSTNGVMLRLKTRTW